MIAVWEVRLPASVANPMTFSLSSIAVCDGVRSWLMTMHGSTRSRRKAGCRLPVRLFMMREETSRMSAARSRRYSSSLAARVLAYFSANWWKAASALIFWCWMRRVTSSIRVGSSRTSRCASKMLASFTPRVWVT